MGKPAPAYPEFRGYREPRFLLIKSAADPPLDSVMIHHRTSAGDVNEGDLVGPQLDHVGELKVRSPKTITADAGYAYAQVFNMAEQSGINAVIGRTQAT
jgi:hypothetical protein